MERPEMIKRRRGGEEFWREILEQFESSGKTVQEFCEEEELRVKTFSHWQRRLKKQGRGFRGYELSLSKEPPPYEVVLGNGRSVRLGCRFDVGVVKALVSLLG